MKTITDKQYSKLVENMTDECIKIINSRIRDLPFSTKRSACMSCVNYLFLNIVKSIEKIPQDRLAILEKFYSLSKFELSDKEPLE